MGKINESKVDYWLTDDGLTLIEAWARDGLTMEEFCGKMGISRETFRKWRNRYPEINEAMSVGKELIDYKVENALLKAALGFTTKEIKVTLGKKMLNGEVYEVLKETTTREVAPNVTACMAWLNNRKHDQWKRNRDKVLDLTEEDSNINITIVRGPKTEEALGENTNQEVKFETKNEQPVENSTPKNSEEDLDYWPDDWDEEE